MTAPDSFSRLRVTLILLGIALPGVIAATLSIPQTLAAGAVVEGPEEPWWVYAVAMAQSVALVGLAAWGGTVWAPRVGLRAPAAEALAARQPLLAAMHSQWVPGLVGAGVGTLVLVVAGLLAPPEIQAIGDRFAPGLATRLLYGGITEEVLVRWGLMSVIAGVLWRLAGRRESVWQIAAAIVVSALVFGLGHLPIASLLVETVTPAVVVYIILGNAAFGFVAGVLFWKYGLESAILAHIGTHLGVVAVSGLMG